MKRKWKAAEVVHALRVAYGVAGSQLVQDEWSLLTEVPLRAPRANAHRPDDENYWSNTRTIDVFLTRNWSSGVGNRRIAVEVKVSRSDYRNETDLKRLPAERAAHQTYYAAPAGIIDPATLPDGWGLIEVYGTREEFEAAKGWVLGPTALFVAERREGLDAFPKVSVRPTLREPVCNLDVLVATAMRRASRAEEKIRRGENDATAVPGLRADVARLEAQLERRETALHVERDKVGKVITEMLSVADQVCSDCREPVGYHRGRGRWTHTDREQEGRCEEARAEANRREKEAQYGARYSRGWAEPVRPLAQVERMAALPPPEYGSGY